MDSENGTPINLAPVKDQIQEVKLDAKTMSLLFEGIKLLMAAKKVKNDPNLCKVTPNLYIGSIGAATNLKKMTEEGITHVLCCAKSMKPAFPKEFIYKCLDVLDNGVENVKKLFEETNGFIKESVDKNGKVLVHCFAGISRSTTFLAAYLIKHHSLSFEESIQLIKSARNIVRPNMGFAQQLKEYDVACTSNRILEEILERIEHENTQENEHLNGNERIGDTANNNQETLEEKRPCGDENIEQTENNKNKNQTNEVIQENEVTNDNLKYENVETKEINEKSMEDDKEKSNQNQDVLMIKESHEENTQIIVNDQVEEDQELVNNASEHETKEITLLCENKTEIVLQSKDEQINFKESEETQKVTTEIDERNDNDTIPLQNQNEPEIDLEDKGKQQIEIESEIKLETKDSNNLADGNEKLEVEPEIINEQQISLLCENENKENETTDNIPKNDQKEEGSDMLEIEEKKKVNSNEEIMINEENINGKTTKPENIENTSSHNLEETNKNDEEEVKVKSATIEETENIEYDDNSNKILEETNNEGLKPIEPENKPDNTEKSENIEINKTDKALDEQNQNEELKEKISTEEESKNNVNLEVKVVETVIEQKEEKQTEEPKDDGPQIIKEMNMEEINKNEIEIEEILEEQKTLDAPVQESKPKKKKKKNKKK